MLRLEYPLQHAVEMMMTLGLEIAMATVMRAAAVMMITMKKVEDVKAAKQATTPISTAKLTR